MKGINGSISRYDGGGREAYIRTKGCMGGVMIQGGVKDKTPKTFDTS